MNVTCVVVERANEIVVRHCSLRAPGDYESWPPTCPYCALSRIGG
ncbi:MAG: hypothetical protein ABIH24_09100 [Verrucomicrobiota bacterium]